MRVFHGPINVAGIAGLLARAERNAGINSFSYCLPSGSYRYFSDFSVKANTPKKMELELVMFAARQAWRIDVFHFYFGHSLTLSHLADIPILKMLGKKVFFYFHGCDIRDSKDVIYRYPINACREHWPMACSANRKKAIAVAGRYANGIFVSTPDLLEFIPGSIWLPQPIDLEHFKLLRDTALASVKKSRAKKRNIIISHAPSDRMIKGTHYLEQAVQKLVRKGYPVKLQLVEKMSYEEALVYYAKSNIAVDQLLIGSYGMFAVEMMAMGKPVICYLRDDLVKQHFPADLPIISATPENIADVLEDAIEHKTDWPDIGEQGIRYVEQVHDSRVIAAKTIERYYSAR